MKLVIYIDYIIIAYMDWQMGMGYFNNQLEISSDIQLNDEL